MIYTVHIRGVKETAWKLLKDKVREKYISWDSTAFADGEYRLRITASDSPSNPPAQALNSSLDSEVFLIDNTPPRITGLAATRNGGKVSVRWKAQDGQSVIAKAEYSLERRRMAGRGANHAALGLTRAGLRPHAGRRPAGRAYHRGTRAG